MYRILNIRVSESDAVYAYLDRIAHLSNNLSNAVLFRQRQMITSAKKDVKDWTDNEKEIRNEVEATIQYLGNTRKIPKSGVLSYNFTERVLRATQNPDFFAEGLPRQTAQWIIKQVCTDITSFYKAMKQYAVTPELFTGKPELPGYKRKGGACSFRITNQDCVIRQKENGAYEIKLPLTKDTVCIGKTCPGRLKEVHVSPKYGRYQLSLVFDDGKALSVMEERPERIAAIDPGVNNLMAVTNNCGLPCLLFKGGVIKSVNQRYNKRVAKIMSKQTKGSDKKFIPSEEYWKDTNYRNDKIKDVMLKAGKSLILWCVENRIDTIVIGSNPGWKQKVSLGKETNQKFVQIPFDKLKHILKYQGERNGIRILEQEEAYTSKASFMDQDEIPDLGEETSFSGTRIHRGLYRTKDGENINADLNGSANILRKAFPDAFSGKSVPDFKNIVVIKHPDEMLKNQKNVVSVERDTGDVNPHQVERRSRLNGNLDLIL